MMKSFFPGLLLAALSTTAAFAHISLETGEAPVGSTYKAVFRVPHGCDGVATTGLRIQIPQGVTAAKPMPKAGWTLKTVKAGETVGEVEWTGGDLPDEFYDEFVIRVSLSADLAAGSVLHFPVIQQCGDASDAWIEIPVEGQPEPELPAPGLKLLPAKASSH